MSQTVTHKYVVKQLHLVGYRGLRDITLEFAPKLTVLVGKNGCGKSSVLQALALLLSQVQDALDEGTPQQLAYTDVNVGNNETQLRLSVELDEKNLTIERAWTRCAMTQVVKTADTHLPVVCAADPVPVQVSRPLAVYYPVDLALLVAPRRPHNSRGIAPHPAYVGALSGAGADYPAFFEWFREQEEIENKERLGNAAFRLRTLEAVRGAITGLLPDVTDPQIKLNPPRMFVRKGGVDLAITQLSNGEKNLLALAGDLARRLALANSALHDPLQGSAVVLLDEIELHLHPGWQRQMIPRLLATFSGCQFVVTTHSPQVLGLVNAEHVRLLLADKGQVQVRSIEAAYGRDANQILTDVMDLPERPEEVETQLLRLFRLIDDGDLVTARTLRQELLLQIGPMDPELLRAEAFLRRKEALKG